MSTHDSNLTPFQNEHFESRKQDHIRFALDPTSQTTGLSGLDRVRLEHDALPELNFDQISLSMQSLGQSRATPFFISSMTAGHAEAAQLNRRLAAMADKRGWAMGLGSQRRDLHRASEAGIEGAEIKEQFSSLELYSNLGISQVIETPIEVIQNLVRRSGASALCIHLNGLQEVMQPEGTPQFLGAVDKIRECVETLGLPVILKETGSGFSKTTLRKISKFSLGAVDVSGVGGTHWGRIEGMRAAQVGASIQENASKTFKNWGISTVESTLNARELLDSKTEVWSSGGVKTGLDAAKLIALGATRVGFAQSALEAALKGSEALELWAATCEFELKTALFCMGSSNCQNLLETQKWTIV